MSEFLVPVVLKINEMKLGYVGKLHESEIISPKGATFKVVNRFKTKENIPVLELEEL